MLGDYALYKKLEEHIDNKISELKNENIYTVGKAILPLIATYVFKSFDSSFFLYVFMVFLFALFLACLKPVREWAAEPFFNAINLFKFNIGTSLVIKDYQNKLDYFDEKFNFIMKDLAVLKSLSSSIDHYSADLFIFLLKSELEIYKNEIFQIGTIINNDIEYEVENTKNAKHKLDIAIDYYCNLVEQIIVISSFENVKNGISNQAHLYLKDIRDFSYNLRKNFQVGDGEE